MMVVSSSSLSSSCSSASALAFASSSFFFSSSSCSSFSSLSSGRFPKKKALHPTAPTGFISHITVSRCYASGSNKDNLYYVTTYYSCALVLGSYKSSFHLSLLNFPAQLKLRGMNVPNIRKHHQPQAPPTNHHTATHHPPPAPRGFNQPPHLHPQSQVPNFWPSPTNALPLWWRPCSASLRP